MSPVWKEGRKEERKEGRKEAKHAMLDLVFTGELNNDRVRVDVHGKAVWLTPISFLLLVDLFAARLGTESGSIECHRRRVHRLRRELGARIGKQPIQRAGGGEYCLGIARANIAQSVGVTPCFFELVERALVSATNAELIRQWCRPCVPREIK